ncbi:MULTISPECIES: ABC transporter ATP-binding protein [Pseudomonas syringae group genomosp. 2]|uniref:ABC transporter related protein n=1 Tax=Pseudomonas amygdali pv. mori str. 301020 TaxID=629261 RepID=A0A656G4Q3_PSEA0|nr:MULTISPECIES: ABC transporter ATP-binding protein [Pseudomonas syringae group genomosp. 2]EGH20541.1 ABC transporter related protein [Pseudomonas amygdali pv. mori str. 301020]PPS24167.1 sugar ABC transporter ATP-binding protein [Pseudomonas amygdali pv. morsprunorum]
MASIELNNVSLKFPVITELGGSLRRQLVNLTTGGAISSDNTHTIHIHALKDINLSVKEGDRIGLIGHNGAGKSSLLRMLAGIYTPTSGVRSISGSVRALFELGVGTDHELTGRANIERLSRLYGYSLKQVKEDIHKIEEFSGLGGYLDLPIRTYSSGMQLRLLFSISTLYPSDILLIDEVFGVGDEAFQDKARQRMQDMMSSSKIVIMASHSKDIINKFCNKTIKLEAGGIVEINNIESTL